MEFMLNVSSTDFPITDTLPPKKKLRDRNGQINEAETKIAYKNPLAGWVAGQTAMYATVGLSPEKKKELGMKAKLVHAPEGWSHAG